jgi:protein involved in polysaccharide export with SLBB domain
MYDIKKMIIILIIIIMTPNIFGYNLTMDLKTTPDNSYNIYYITQSTPKKIMLGVHSDYLPLEQFKESKIEYNLKIVNGINQNIFLSLSKNKEFFKSEINSKIYINIKPDNFYNKIIKAEITANLYDEYNNLISTNSKLIVLIANNSNEIYPNTYNKAEPKFNGYTFSRDISVLLNKQDTDNINIREFIKSGFIYNLICIPNTDGIISKVSYLKNNNFDLNISIDNNKTTLLQIITKAGGPTEDADLSNAYLQRFSKEDLREPEFTQLRKTLLNDMSHQEYRYFRNVLREETGIFAKNFQMLWNNKEIEYDINLKNEDVIYFPAKAVAVKVSGEVTNPGLINYDTKLTYLEYIDLAGGFTDKAWKGKIKIIRANTGEWIHPNKKTVLYPGDTIFIPHRERFSYYWPYIQETISFITGLATSIIVIRSLINN